MEGLAPKRAQPPLLCRLFLWVLLLDDESCCRLLVFFLSLLFFLFFVSFSLLSVLSLPLCLLCRYYKCCCYCCLLSLALLLWLLLLLIFVVLLLPVALVVPCGLAVLALAARQATKATKQDPPPPIGAKKKTSCKSPHNKNKNWRDSASEIKGSSESDTQQDFPVTMQLRSWFCFELVGDCQKFVVCGSKSLRGSQFEARIDKLYLNRMRNGLYMIHVSKM